MWDPDYRCIGQGDGTFLCEYLKQDEANLIGLVVCGVLVFLMLMALVIHMRLNHE